MKGIAIPYIIALILGIIILGIIIYMVYKAWQGGSWDCVECKAKFTTWCSECYMTNMGKGAWTGGNKLGEDRYNCVKACGYWSSPPETVDNQDCTGAENPCQSIGVPF